MGSIRADKTVNDYSLTTNNQLAPKLPGLMNTQIADQPVKIWACFKKGCEAPTCNRQSFLQLLMQPVTRSTNISLRFSPVFPCHLRLGSLRGIFRSVVDITGFHGGVYGLGFHFRASLWVYGGVKYGSMS